jgi:hypothetical protein
MASLPQRLIYSSRFGSGFPTLPEDQQDEIIRIISVSIRNNRDVAVTGLLLAHAGCFVQALEGPAKAVDETFARILRDSRLDRAKVLAQGPARREFANWNMCARRLSRADDAIVASLGGTALDPSSWTAAQALGLLLEVKDRQDATMTALP